MVTFLVSKHGNIESPAVGRNDISMRHNRTAINDILTLLVVMI